jgi:predicted dehydrogenase
MKVIPFAIVGTGWRAEFYLRVARWYPERFKVVGLVSRGNQAVEAKFGVKTYRNLDELLQAAEPRFVVTSVPWDVNPSAVEALVARGMPVLSETPPAPDLQGMVDLYRTVSRLKGRVQVAEQVHLRPHHQAQIRLARGGRLGDVHEAFVSVAHGYHGISVMRRLLGIGFENATITGSRFVAPIVEGPGRGGPPRKKKIVTAPREFYGFHFGAKLGVVDFTDAQYFGWIRSEQLQVRGTHGELVNDRLSYLKDFKTPIRYPLTRVTEGEGGDLNALRLVGYQAGGHWVYKNLWGAPGMMDDEIAVAEALTRMDAYVRTGRDFYALAEGCQDHYLWLVALEACKTGRRIETRTQIWGRGGRPGMRRAG